MGSRSPRSSQVGRSEAPPFTIRRGTVADIEELVRLRAEMQAGLDVSAEDAPRIAAFNRRYFAEKMPSGEFVVFLAECEGRIAATSGMVIFQAPPTHGNPNGVEGYIMNMYTLPPFRRRGLATALVQALLAHLRSLGAGRVWLRASDEGRPVYAALGFQENPRYMQRSL